MTYTNEIEEGVLRIKLNGDLIGETSGSEIIQTATSALKSGNEKCLIDISDVRYINSSGIGVLITLLTKFRNQGGDIVLINPSEHVNKLLIMIKLRNIFNIAQSEEEGLKLINK
jgi:anti-sigma B factor antagonist